MGAVAALAIVAAPAAAAAPPSAVPGGLLSAAPAVLSPGPPNGDLAERARRVGGGRPGAAPSCSPPGARIGGNVDARVAAVHRARRAPRRCACTLRARGGGGAGGGERAPAGRRARRRARDARARTRRRASGRSASPPSPARAVRIVLDPVPALGTSVEVLGRRPGHGAAARLDRRRRGRSTAAAAPGAASWRVAGRARCGCASPRFRPGSGARELLVAVRGDGVAARRRRAPGGRAAGDLGLARPARARCAAGGARARRA